MIKNIFKKTPEPEKSTVPPVAEDAFVHENLKKENVSTIDVKKEFVDISLLGQFFYLGKKCYISQELYRLLVQPYESRRKYILTDIFTEMEIYKRQIANDPEKFGLKSKERYFKGMYFVNGFIIKLNYTPWNYLDKCPLPQIKIMGFSGRDKEGETCFTLYGVEHQNYSFKLS